MKVGDDNKTKYRALRAAQRQTPNAKRQTPNETGAKIYDLEERLLEYSARVIRLVDSLFNSRAANHIGGQLLRSGTAPLSSHGEAQAAESIEDFIHKLKICNKELHESWRWLLLIRLTPLLAKPKRADPLIQETDELIRIFSKSLLTAEANRDSRVHEEPPEPDIDPWLIHFNLAFDVKRLAFGVKPPEGLVNYRKRVDKPTARKPRRASRR
jgi:four helix bundle protein